jgi:hypothetical protein
MDGGQKVSVLKVFNWLVNPIIELQFIGGDIVSHALLLTKEP